MPSDCPVVVMLAVIRWFGEVELTSFPVMRDVGDYSMGKITNFSKREFGGRKGQRQ